MPQPVPQLSHFEPFAPLTNRAYHETQGTTEQNTDPLLAALPPRGPPHILSVYAGLGIASEDSAEDGTEIVETATMAQPVREAALKPSAANSYPYLPARMWTPARRLAELVAKYRGLPAEALDRLNRVLSDQDFVFRGGGGPATA